MIDWSDLVSSLHIHHLSARRIESAQHITQDGRTMADLPSKECEVAFSVPGIHKPCKTWYNIVGDISPNGTKSGKTPLVVVHDGPGAGHDYLLPLTDLFTKYSRPIIFYDQIGNGAQLIFPSKMVTSLFGSRQCSSASSTT